MILKKSRAIDRWTRKLSLELPVIPAYAEIDMTTHTTEELYLYAFATQAEILHHIRTDTVPSEQKRIDEIMRTWQKMQIRVTELIEREEGEAESIKYGPLPATHTTWLKKLTQETLFQKTFQNLPVSFSLVEIDKMIAPQRTVDLRYVKKLQKTYKPPFDVPQLLDICLSPHKPTDLPSYLEAHANTHVFSSPHSDIRFLGSYQKKLTAGDHRYAETGGVPVKAIVVFVGYGYAPINVFQVEKRMVLNNGFHRVYALRSLGVTHIPVVVQHINNVELEFPRSVLGLPRTYLLNHPRPVLIKDFFEKGFIIPLRVLRRLHAVKVNVNASTYEIPY